MALFLRLANENRFGAIKKKLDNMHLFGQNAYPKTLEEAKTYLENFQLEMVGNRQNRQQQKAAEQGVAFAQHGSEGRQIGPCHNCGRMGHLVANCPDLNDEEKMAIQQAYQIKNKDGKAKTGQAHVNVGNGAANKELQECLEGVANVNVNLDDVSISRWTTTVSMTVWDFVPLQEWLSSLL